MDPEFQPYGLPHLAVIFLTVVLPFALAAIVRRAKSQRLERIIIGVLSAVLVLNYIVYLVFIRSHGVVDWRFISFFTSHCGIIIGVVFLMLTRRYRPYPMSIVRVWLWSEFYFVVTLITDELTGYNYGFLLHKPEAFSILSFLSDSRPLYVLELHGVALLFFLGLYAPFAVVDLVTKKSRRNAGKQQGTL
jgi:hypothetical protein